VVLVVRSFEVDEKLLVDMTRPVPAKALSRFKTASRAPAFIEPDLDCLQLREARVDEDFVPTILA
jgi:hypothetical protein